HGRRSDADLVHRHLAAADGPAAVPARARLGRGREGRRVLLQHLPDPLPVLAAAVEPDDARADRFSRACVGDVRRVLPAAARVLVLVSPGVRAPVHARSPAAQAHAGGGLELAFTDLVTWPVAAAGSGACPRSSGGRETARARARCAAASRPAAGWPAFINRRA